jgi:bifunctional DNA-binding transcriptional regulator/antitoxin component of YhaV-PrlF toxin-antitoxin module
MARGIATKTKVQVSELGQVMLTVPKPLAAAMGMQKGDEVVWKVAGAGKLEIHLK